MLCVSARLYRLRKNSCFVSGHDFSRAVHATTMRALAPGPFLVYWRKNIIALLRISVVNQPGDTNRHQSCAPEPSSRKVQAAIPLGDHFGTNIRTLSRKTQFRPANETPHLKANKHAGHAVPSPQSPAAQPAYRVLQSEGFSSDRRLWTFLITEPIPRLANQVQNCGSSPASSHKHLGLRLNGLTSIRRI